MTLPPYHSRAVRMEYERLCQKGLSHKYDHPGIYCIKANNEIIYIGKSTNMMWRVAEHLDGIRKAKTQKYQLIAAIKQ